MGSLTVRARDVRLPAHSDLANGVYKKQFDQDLSIRTRLLAAAADRLTGAGSQDEIIDIVRTSARGVCSADGVTFVLRDGNRCYYVDEDAIGPLWKGQRFPMAHCISGWCMLHAKTAAIEDVFADSRIPHNVYRATFVKSLIMTPVGKDSPIAAIGLYWADQMRFVSSDIAIAEALAAAVTTSMRAAQAA
jgi:hypothetical protein